MDSPVEFLTEARPPVSTRTFIVTCNWLHVTLIVTCNTYDELMSKPYPVIIVHLFHFIEVTDGCDKFWQRLYVWGATVDSDRSSCYQCYQPGGIPRIHFCQRRLWKALSDDSCTEWVTELFTWPAVGCWDDLPAAAATAADLQPAEHTVFKQQQSSDSSYRLLILLW